VLVIQKPRAVVIRVLRPGLHIQPRLVLRMGLLAALLEHITPNRLGAHILPMEALHPERHQAVVQPDRATGNDGRASYHRTGMAAILNT
jgi:hypothetical protein